MPGNLLLKKKYLSFKLVIWLFSLGFLMQATTAANNVSQAPLDAMLQRKHRDFMVLLSDFASTVTEMETFKGALEQERGNTQNLLFQMQSLEAKLAQLEADWLCKTHMNSGLQSELAQEKSRAKALFETALKVRAESIRKERQLEERLNELAEHNRLTVEKLQAQKQELQQVLEETKAKVPTAEQLAENKWLSTKLQLLEREFMENNQQLAVLKAQNASICKDFKEQQRTMEAESLKAIKRMEDRFCLQQDELDVAREQVQALTQEKAKIIQEIEALRGAANALRQEKTNLMLGCLQDRLATEKNFGSKLLQVRQLVVDKCVSTQDVKQSLAQQAKELQAKLLSVEEENQQLSQQLGELGQQLSTSTAKSKAAVNLVLERLKAEQASYLQKLVRLKRLVNDGIASKETVTLDYQKQLGALMEELITHKRLYSQAFQDLKVAQAKMSALQMQQDQDVDKGNDPLQQQLARKLASQIEKLENRLASASKREKMLSEQLNAVRSESSILQTSVDEIFATNEKLVNENQLLQGKVHESESNLQQLQQQARELAKREAELIERVVSIERQTNAQQNLSPELEAKLIAARNDYAALKNEVVLLSQKLMASSQIARGLGEELQDYKQQVVEANRLLETKVEETNKVRDKMRLLLANMGLKIDELSTTGKNDYLQLVANYQHDKLAASVLRNGKAKMEDELNQILKDEDLLCSMVNKLQQRVTMLQNCTQENNFGQIFKGLHKNGLNADFSRLYALFLALGSLGGSSGQAFKQYLRLCASYFGDPELLELNLVALGNPQNALLIKLIS